MIRVHTLGGLAVRGGDGKPVVGSGAQPRRMAILALLARAGERGTSLLETLDGLDPVLRKIVRDQAGWDIDRLEARVRRALGLDDAATD